MTKVEIEFKQVSDLIDSKYNLLAENKALKEQLDNTENELHITNIKLENASYLCKIYDTDLEKARQIIDNYSKETEEI